MAIKSKKTVLIPILGQDFSLPSTLLNEKNHFGQNVIEFQGDLKQRMGHTTYGTGTISGAVIHLSPFQLSDLTLKMIRLSIIKTQVYNSGTTAWDDITLSGVAWTGVEGTDFFDDAVFNDKLLLTNGIDVIQQYTGTGKCTNLAGTPPKSRYIESFQNYVVCAHIIDGVTRFPTRVQWCDTADETNWSTGNAGSIDLNDDASEIIALKKLDNVIIPYKENVAYIGRLVDSISVFNFQAVTVVGPINNRSIVEHNGIHYYLGRDGNIYAFNGVRPEPIGNEVKTEIFSRINSNRLGVCHGRKNEQAGLIEFFIATGSNSWPEESWAIDHNRGTVFKNVVQNITASSQFKDTSGQLTWNDDSDTWDSDTTRWDDGIGGEGFIFPLLGTSSGTVVKETFADLSDGSTEIDQQIITKDFGFEEHEKYKRWTMLQFYAVGDSVTIDYSIDFGLTWINIPKDADTVDFELTSTMTNYCAYLDTTSPYIRFRFRNNKLGESFKLRQISVTGFIGEALCT